MNILLTRQPLQSDYSGDMVFHGLKKLFGNTVVDAPRHWYMYKKEFGDGKYPIQSMYGRGFTSVGLLDDEEDKVDRTDISSKIRNHFFDLVVLARVDQGSEYQEEIMKHYKPHEIVVLDGQDPSIIHKSFIGKSLYFKRELRKYYYGTDRVFPLSFAFPREKLQTPMNKTRIFSHVDPRDRNTYIHWDESSYYKDYNTSLFGVTMKKQGWDCLRHYEIIGCNSVPLFLDIKDCPTNICTTLPKELLIDVLDTYNRNTEAWFLTSAGSDYYQAMQERIYKHFLENCLTETLAKRIIDKHIIHKS